MQCVQLWLGRSARHLLKLTSSVSPPAFKSGLKVHHDLSMNELAELAEKILQNLNAVFEKDDLLDEFDIVPKESQTNRSPVIHHQHEHKLGLESWCIGFLYTHSFQNFTHLRPQKSVQSSRSELKNFNNDPAGSSSTFPFKNNNVDYAQLTESEKWSKCLELSRLIILLNPDVTVAWNFRREAFHNGYSKLSDELALASLVSSRKPKCSEVFYYRKWLMKWVLERESLDPDQLLRLFRRETKAAFQAASKYFSNYHAWDYRRFLLDTYLARNDVPVDIKLEILKYEKEVSSTWLNTHISDYCGYHYRQILLGYIAKLGLTVEESQVMIMAELKENQGMILFYPGHESLWYHRRILIRLYAKTIGSLTRNELVLLLNGEQNLVDATTVKLNHDVSNMENISKLDISDAIKLNHTYSERHLKWLQTL